MVGLLLHSCRRKTQALLELNCETDFIAKTETFSDLAHHISMQIAATNPRTVDHKSISKKVINRESIYRDQAVSEGKPENIIEKIVKGS